MQLYSGIVEDRNDPRELGRYRVRIFGIHSHDKNEVPTAALPWANPLQPATSAAINGVGQTPKLLLGTNVIVTFMDEDKQRPLILGSIAGIGTESHLMMNGQPVPNDNNSFGFTSMSNGNYVGESDVNRNARSGGTDGLRSTVNAGGIREPEDLRPHRQYPYSQVRFSEGGHFEEWDDTPGNERILTQHVSGSFTEIRPDGTRVDKIVNDNYQLIAGDNKVVISGECTVVIEGDAKLQVGGDFQVDVNKDMIYNVEGSIFFNANEGIYTTTNGDVMDYIVGNRTTLIGKDYDLEVSGDYVNQTVGTQINNVIGDKAEYISGTDSRTIYGNASYTFGANKADLVYGNVLETFNADHTLSIFGNYTHSVQGSIDMASLGESKYSSTQNLSVFTAANLKQHAGAETELVAGSNMRVSASGGTMGIYSNSALDITADGNINIDGGNNIDLNSGARGASSVGAEDPRTVSILEEDIEAFLETKRDESSVASPQTVNMEPAEIEVSIDVPQTSVASTQRGSIPLENYNPLLQGGSGNSLTTNSNPNNFDSSYYDGEGREVSEFENITYQLGGIRNKVVNKDLEELLSIAAKESGVDEVVIVSGKQPGKTGRRTGSTRHDTGWAADFDLKKDGRVLSYNSTTDRQIMTEFTKAAVALGIRAGGISSGYMGPTRFHMDTLGSHVGGPPWDSSRISTWRSAQWFIDAMHNPRGDLEPTESFIANSQTHINTGESVVVYRNNGAPSTSRPPLDRKEVSLLLAEKLRGVGFNDEECLAATAVAFNESGLDLSTEIGYTRTANARIREVFSVTRNMSDDELNRIKQDDYTWFEFVYGVNSPRRTISRQLGNIEVGDGYKYIGRGLIQHTGRYAYETKARQYGFGNTLVDNPELLASDWDVALQYTAKYLEERYQRGRYSDVLWAMRKAVAGSDAAARLNIEHDRHVFRDLDRSWIHR